MLYFKIELNNVLVENGDKKKCSLTFRYKYSRYFPFVHTGKSFLWDVIRSAALHDDDDTLNNVPSAIVYKDARQQDARVLFFFFFFFRGCILKC